MQATDIEAGHRRRPIEPGGADVTHCPKASVRSRVATARGCRWALQPGLPGAICIVRALAEILFKANHALNRFPTPAVARCRSALEPGCVYPNKGSRRDANASAAGASPKGVLLAVRTRNFPRKTQPSSAERHRAPPGVAEARATHRGAIVQLGRPRNYSAPRPLSVRLFPYSRLEETSGPSPPPREKRTASFAARLYPKRPLPGVQPEKLLGTRKLGFSPQNSAGSGRKTFESQQTAIVDRAGQPPPTGWLRCRSALENWSLLRQLPPCG